MPRTKKVPTGMPAVADAKGAEREQLATWWAQRVRAIEEGYLARIDRLMNGEEHPIPAFAAMVREWGAFGMKPAVCARMLGLSQTSFVNHYGEDYEVGSFEIISNVAKNALRIATSETDPNAGRLAMQILDRRGGPEWIPPAQRIKVDKPDDGPPVIDSSKLTPEDREALRQICERQLLRQDEPEEGESSE
jgi:hypothetical protein